MKNIANNPSLLFNGNWYLSALASERSKRETLRSVQSRIAVYVYIIGRAKRTPHWGVQSRFRVIICNSYTMVVRDYR